MLNQMSNHKNLFVEFSPVSKEAWLKKIEKDLKGKPLEDLKWQLDQNLTVDPFYHADDQIGGTQIHYGNLTHNDWKIGEDFHVTNPPADNKRLLEVLAKGVNAPMLIFQTAPPVQTFNELFKGIIPDYIHTSFKITSPSPDYLTLLKNYYSYLQSQNIDSSSLKGALLVPSESGDIQGAVKTCEDFFPAFHCINLDFNALDGDPSSVTADLTRILHNTDQLLQRLAPEQVPFVQFTISVGTSYFIEIAKIRAIRVLWTNLLNAYGVRNTPLAIDAYVGPNTFDDHVNNNMIRSMTIAMSAVIGGINRLTILPADRKGTNSSQRIARNVQHILKMESYLDRVIDPSAGSFYIEKLTKLFAEKAWERFKNH